jgi:hypothetical protein
VSFRTLNDGYQKAMLQQAQLNAVARSGTKYDAQVVAETPEPSEKASGFVGWIQAEHRAAAIAPSPVTPGPENPFLFTIKVLRVKMLTLNPPESLMLRDGGNFD